MRTLDGIANASLTGSWYLSSNMAPPMAITAIATQATRKDFMTLLRLS
jgi:hypothetical protein